MNNPSITRRRFLGSAAGAAAMAWGRPKVFAQAPSSAGGARLSACIESVFRSQPFEAALDKVKAVGLDAYEFWGYGGKDLDALKRKQDELGLTLATFGCDPRGALVAPDSKGPFVEGLADGIQRAKEMDCTRLLVTVGQERKDISRDAQRANIVEALRAGAPLLEEAGITLVVEPLNILVNHRGYFLSQSKEAFQIIDEVGSSNVKILFDIYHQQISEGNLIANITANIDKIGHFHVADNPGRHEPGTGEINYTNVFAAIRKTGFDGFVGMEMWPVGDHAEAVRKTMGFWRG